MAKKKQGRPKMVKAPFSKKHFKEAMKKKGFTLIQMADMIEYSEKTLRRAETDGKINPDILDQIALILDVDPLYIQGEYKKRATLLGLSPEEQEEMIRPENFPYYRYKARILDLDRLIQDILLYEDIDPHEYETMSEKEQRIFLVDLNIALLQTVRVHFPQKHRPSSNYSIPMPPEDEIVQL